MAAGRPSITEIKLLFARSGNQCAFPKCDAPLAFNNTLTGEICHIKGTRPGSARHDTDQTDLQRHQYDNLILLCPTHHTVIDADEDSYSVDRLIRMKKEHEEQSTSIPDSVASSVAELAIQSITNVAQSGGISAHTVNASTISLQGGPSTNHLTRQRQIHAVEHLWRIARNLKKEFNLVIFIDTVLTAQELDDYFKSGDHSQLADCLLDYADMSFCLAKMESAGCNDADEERPFLSHRTWSVFFVLKAMYGRSAMLLTNSYKGRSFKNWRADDGCDQLLRAILPANVIDQIKKKECGGLQSAIDYLESQFFAEAGMNQPQP